MFQKDHLLKWINIWDNVVICLEIKKDKNDESIKHVERFFKTYGLWE